MGPAVRAVASGARRVTFLCGPRGAEAARLLPGIDEVLVQHIPWIDAGPRPVDRREMEALVDRLAGLGIDQALVLTSHHQSPLPMALLLRLAGIGCIAATSVDYPGSLLDVRHRSPGNVHEVERALSLVATLGYRLPPHDNRALTVRMPGPTPRPALERPFGAVHPGASVPARAWSPDAHAALVDLLVERGRRVVGTGAPDEIRLTARVAGARRPEVANLGGKTSLAALAAVLGAADAVVVGNTGPAHLAAAVGTPVVSLFAPTVPADRWRPWGVPHVLLGDQAIPCAGCRARECPVRNHPCLTSVTPEEVVAAVLRLMP